MKSVQTINEHSDCLIEDKLKQSEERFSLAMRGANDGLWDWDLLTDKVYYSPRWKNMLGYENHELENDLDTWAKLVNPEDKVMALKKVQDCMEGKVEEFEVEMRMQHKDGSTVIVLSRGFLVKRESDDRPVRLAGTHVDITERKKNEEFVKNTNTILEIIAMGKPASEIYDAIALMYEARHPGMRCSLLELKDGKLMHGGAPSMPKEYCEAVHGLQNGPNIGSCGTSTYTGKRVLVENIQTDPKWKNIKQFALPHGMRCCWSEPIIDSTGKILGAFGMYYNYPSLPNIEESKDLLSAARLSSIVMERDQSQKRMQEDQKLIAEQSKLASMGEMIGNIAHQWRQPLTAISAIMANMKLSIDLEEELTNEDIKIRIDKVSNQCQYLSSTIDNFRHFFNDDSTNIKKFNLRHGLCDTIDLIKDSFISNSIEINSVLISCIINDNKNTFIQSMLNIFNNTKDAMILNNIPKADRYMFIEMKKNGKKLILTFKDSGGGIDEKIINKIFHPYFTTKHQSQGTGLGLYMTHQIIVKHLKGSITIENIEYEYKGKNLKGVNFTIMIPLNS